MIHPKPGWAELDPDILWQSIEYVIRESVKKSINDPVKALSVSVQCEAVVPVNSKGENLYNFVVTFDDRTIPQWKWWEREVGKDGIFEIIGMPLHPMYSLNKIMWFQQSMPKVFQNAWKFLCMEDFIFLKLGIKPTIDYSLTARTMAFDVRKKVRSEEILSFAKINKKLLAQVKPSGEIIGEIPVKIAQELGFDKNVAVVTGGHDQF